MNKMSFKQYLENTQSNSLTEEIISGGLLKMFKHLQYWFDRGPENTADRIAKLEQALVNAGGARKFAIIVRKIPSIRSFMLRHKDELEGKLAKAANLL